MNKSSVAPASATGLPDSKFNYSWVVPVTFITDKERVVQKVLLNATQNYTDAEVELGDDILWIKANMNATGYYIVNYPEEVGEDLNWVI